MKKKNGFTLIELLAVIVILAIIALIAVPIIMNVINEAKKGAAKDSMYGYVEAIELEIAKAMLTDQNLLTGEYTTKTGDLYSGSTKALSVSFKGTKPDDNGTLTLTNGRVTKAELTFGGHSVIYNGTKVENEEEVKIYKKYENGTAIYYNPVSGTKCNQNEAVSYIGTKTGCMKWYAFLDNETSSTVTMILDHNTTENVEAGEDATIAIGQLNKDTENWSSSNISPRLITADEIAKIVGADREDTLKWSSKKPYGTDIETKSAVFLLEGYGSSYDEWNNFVPTKSKYEWLYGNINANGYWTSTTGSPSKDYGWLVLIYGTDSTHYYLWNEDIYVSSSIRPVVTVSKKSIQ